MIAYKAKIMALDNANQGKSSDSGTDTPIDSKKPIIVVNSTKQFPLKLKNVTIISARRYISDASIIELKKATVYNLCSSYRYQTWGYYVSLLADARGHQVFPSASAIRDFKSASIIKSISEDLEELFQTALRKVASDKFELYISFRQSLNADYAKLAKELYDLFQAPLLRATFLRVEGKWQLQNISPVAIGTVPASSLPMLESFAQNYFSVSRVSKRVITKPYFDLAILVDPEEIEPPSNRIAINKFIKIGKEMNINVELITKADYQRIPEYDALFIRTSSVDPYIYRFSRFAQTEGLAVIDDPNSILKCTNKVYLYEILHKSGIPTPQTIVVYGGNYEKIAETHPYPCVMKTPDGFSSLGVAKIHNSDEFKKRAKSWLEGSDLLLVQEYLPTSFDWRIGVLDRKFYYACKYFMPTDHWQIYKWGTKSHAVWGKLEAIPYEEVPKDVVTTALRAANLIGDGLYGVDIKVVDGQVYVMEVNENASLDHRFEDTLLKDDLYRIMLRSFARRVAALNSSKDLAI